jgi:glycerol-3-phosphate acyltransferase PlsY
MAGKKAGVLTLLLDAGKGYLPTALAMHMLEPEPTALVGLAAVVGHCFSVYLGFKGGKGVATFLGVLLAISPWACLGVAALIAGLAWVSNYMAVGSLIGCLSAPFWLWWLGADKPFILMAAAMGVVVVWRHRGNLGRLMRGEESSWRNDS